MPVEYNPEPITITKMERLGTRGLYIEWFQPNYGNQMLYAIKIYRQSDIDRDGDSAISCQDKLGISSYSRNATINDIPFVYGKEEDKLVVRIFLYYKDYEMYLVAEDKVPPYVDDMP